MLSAVLPSPKWLKSDWKSDFRERDFLLAVTCVDMVVVQYLFGDSPILHTDSARCLDSLLGVEERTLLEGEFVLTTMLRLSSWVKSESEVQAWAHSSGKAIPEQRDEQSTTRDSVRTTISHRGTRPVESIQHSPP